MKQRERIRTRTVGTFRYHISPQSGKSETDTVAFYGRAQMEDRSQNVSLWVGRVLRYFAYRSWRLTSPGQARRSSLVNVPGTYQVPTLVMVQNVGTAGRYLPYLVGRLTYGICFRPPPKNSETIKFCNWGQICILFYHFTGTLLTYLKFACAIHLLLIPIVPPTVTGTGTHLQYVCF